MINIKFYGAAGTVTGSHYVITTPQCKFAVDAGMFQGIDVESWNLKDYDYDPSELDFVLLTHSHIDHSGMLPKLKKAGFNGPIYATPATIKITTELLLDSAKIQESNFEKGLPYGKFTNIRAIVYGIKDVESTLELLRSVNFNEEFSPFEGIKVKFLVAGHILGAASIEVSFQNEGDKKIVFSGDVGRFKSPIIQTFDLEYKSQADAVLLEALYGGQYHPDREQTTREFIQVINQTIKSGGSVFIPSFAVERTQELINNIRLAKEMGEMDPSIKVYLDSPLAQRITRIYTNSLDTNLESKFDFQNLIYIHKTHESRILSNKKGIVVIAGSGMADGGRIVGHLIRALKSRKNAVIFVGFQAEGTAGRELVEGARTVMLEGQIVDVKAKVYHFKGFSAHGDTADYLKWINRYGIDNKKIFLVHAEKERSNELEYILKDQGYDNIIIPQIGQEFDV